MNLTLLVSLGGTWDPLWQTCRTPQDSAGTGQRQPSWNSSACCHGDNHCHPQQQDLAKLPAWGEAVGAALPVILHLPWQLIPSGFKEQRDPPRRAHPQDVLFLVRGEWGVYGPAPCPSLRTKHSGARTGERKRRAEEPDEGMAGKSKD